MKQGYCFVIDWQIFFMVIRKFTNHNLGNFGLITAIVIPIIVVFAGFAIDTTNMFFTRFTLHKMVDRALMRTASYITSLNELPAEDKVLNTLINNLTFELQDYFSNSDTQYIIKNAGISIQKNIKLGQYNISTISYYKMPIHQINIFHWIKHQTNIIVSSHSSVIAKLGGEKVDSVKVIFVLDASSSMNDTFEKGKKSTKKKIDIMKKSVEILINRLDTTINLKDKQLVEVGAVTFNDKVKNIISIPTTIDNLKKQIKNITAGGSTNSSPAMEKGYQMISSVNGSAKESKKYIVFMTDGKNSSLGYNYSTIKTCDLAKQQGIEIFVVSLRKKEEASTINNIQLKISPFPESCASSDDNDRKHMHYAINENDMINVFNGIGQNIFQKRSVYLNK
ncbi:MAG: hypothetical protein C4617_05520 [Candidatus Liberibacter europaeus]|uniref:VWFA domain-containing protein n=1 Tax=Candidatus Liberibacter europaeus TaxID=744859 RepID=A0A2T4VWE7_9HYPH|nr:hypothetical protein [Candidatus Liberibacter europaeus]PTL86105.1 MAG: hypothetical protein C4617_05520 [Candidatus Liberibacter europaeus]